MDRRKNVKQIISQEGGAITDLNLSQWSNSYAYVNFPHKVKFISVANYQQQMLIIHFLRKVNFNFHYLFLKSN